MTPLRALFLSMCAVLAGSSLKAERLLDFPTENRALVHGQPEKFFMYVDRDFEGRVSKPWQGGQYGFVRGPRREKGELVFATMHEGIDILPVRRDASGEPLDRVLAAASGRVVHVNALPSASNYGRYVVVEHLWEGCRYYTLYAHLGAVDVEMGQPVRQGDNLGRLGYTGRGINRERAHLHFETCMMLSDSYEDWHAAVFPSAPNRHGLFNGLNLAGFDPTRLLLDAEANPDVSISQYIAAGEPFFRVAVPASDDLFLLHAYPWLKAGVETAPAWAITFSRFGIPLRAEPLPNPVDDPKVMWAKESTTPYRHATRGLLDGPRGAPHLTASGHRYIALITGRKP